MPNLLNYKNIREAQNVSSWKGPLRSFCPDSFFLQIRKQGTEKIRDCLHKFSSKMRNDGLSPSLSPHTFRLSLGLGTRGTYFIMLCSAEIVKILE